MKESPDNLCPARPLKVLVVDDDEDTTSSIARLLKIWGHQASVARNGIEAVQEMTDDQPDVILLDLVMPGLSGFDLAKAIHAKSLYKRPFLIAMSGMADDVNGRLAEEAGIDMAYAKPVDCDHLKSVLERLSLLVK